MIEQDTVKLLRECDAGIRMGISSIEEMLGYTKNQELRDVLTGCRSTHGKLQEDINEQLNRFHDEGKEPAAMAKGMSWLKTNMKLAMDDSDSTVADLVTDGCNMGIKSLSRYLNQYQAADEKSKSLAKRLISSEEKLVTDVRRFL
ncbi:MAG: hypothetical protein IJX77_09395 [Ruminococcus sp.]|nr:hypothetical protein [Ruminococcus sp.]